MDKKTFFGRGKRLIEYFTGDTGNLPPSPVSTAPQSLEIEESRDPDSDADLEDWKRGIKSDFEQWMEELSEIPSVEPLTEELDLFSFYKELCILRSEVRKGGRRNQDVLTRFGDGLSDFQKTLSDLQDRLIKLDDEKKESEVLSQKERFLPLVHIVERMERLMERLNSPPRKTLFRNYKNWHRAWTQFKEGFHMSFSHLNDLLKKEGVTRIETVGMPFDPQKMTAIAVETTQEQPPDTVVEEISPGFLFKTRVLKLAEVKVSKFS